VELALNEQQVQFQDSLHRFLGEALPVETLRKLAEAPPAFDQALWNHVVELGLPGILVPDEHGGSGLGLLDAALAAEALGHAVAPVGYIGTVMATTGIVLAGSPAQQRDWLPRIARGEMRIAVAFVPALSGQLGQAEARLDGGRLSGQITNVMDMLGATHVLVVLEDGTAALVDAGASGVTARVRHSVDRTRPLADLTFERVEAQVLEGSRGSLASARRVLDAGRLMLAADTLGAAQNMYDKAVAYAKERVQFGRVIGSFQGVKYVCSDMATMLEPCRAFVWQCAEDLEAATDEARLAACHLKAHLGDVGREISRMATEVHGGIGFTDLLGLHYWLKRIGFDRQMLGNPELCRLEAARLQGWTRA